MQSTPREGILHDAQWLQWTLFGVVERETSPLGEKGRLLISVLEMVPLSRQLPCARRLRGPDKIMAHRMFGRLPPSSADS